MTIGTGLAVLGMWIFVAVMWHSPLVRTTAALLATLGVSVATYFIK